MLSVIGILRTVRHKYLPGRFPGQSLLRSVYRWMAGHAFWIKGRSVVVSIGTTGTYKIDPLLAFGNYEEWGKGHNAGLWQWVEACRGKRTVFDIGAHIGLYSLPASRSVAGGGWVYAFEPGVQNANFLKKHLIYNGAGNVAVIESLVGDTSCPGVEFFEQTEGVDGMNSIVVHKNPAAYTKVVRSQISLDDFCSRQSLCPEVIKIDVEGAEVNVLKGASASLRRCRPLIFLSVHPRHLELLGSSCDQLRALIEELNYDILELDGSAVKELKLKEYLLKPKD